jgi:hypothetical protein
MENSNILSKLFRLGSKVIIYPSFHAGILSIARQGDFQQADEEAKHPPTVLPILVRIYFILVEIQSKESKAALTWHCQKVSPDSLSKSYLEQQVRRRGCCSRIRFGAPVVWRDAAVT